jgi:hypothetical protein
MMMKKIFLMLMLAVTGFVCAAADTTKPDVLTGANLENARTTFGRHNLRIACAVLKKMETTNPALRGQTLVPLAQGEVVDPSDKDIWRFGQNTLYGLSEVEPQRTYAVDRAGEMSVTFSRRSLDRPWLVSTLSLYRLVKKDGCTIDVETFYDKDGCALIPGPTCSAERAGVK